MVFNTTSFKKFAITALAVAGVFSAMNLPFMVMDLKLWFASIFNPMAGDIYPLGVGVVTLVTGGILNIQSPFIFDVMEFTVLGLGVCWYFFYYRRYPFLDRYLPFSRCFSPGVAFGLTSFIPLLSFWPCILPVLIE